MLATKFLDGLGWIRRQVAILPEPGKKPTNRHQAAIDGCHGLALSSTKVISEVRHVPHGDSFHRENFPVGSANQRGELP